MKLTALLEFNVINVSVFFGFIAQIKCITDVNLNSVKWIFFPGPTFNQMKTYSLANAVAVLEHPGFNLNRSTVIYVHGYQESLKRESLRIIVEAYLHRNDTNIILLDWSLIATDFYFKILFRHFLPLSKRLANILIKLFANNLNIDSVHLVGHSFGAHILGVTGQIIQEQTNGYYKIKRITGLDPAGPGFFIILLPIYNLILDENDAEFVDIIHTDAGLYGAPIATGTVDFWPNKGHRFQIGCPKGIFSFFSDDDLCSHWKSWMYWAESVANLYAEKFLSCRLHNFEFDCSNPVPMGIDCPKTAWGSFYLKTNPTQPYARGIH